MARIRIIKDAYDTDTVHVYASIKRAFVDSRPRWLCCCSMHVDAVENVFSVEARLAVEERGELDVAVQAEFDED